MLSTNWKIGNAFSAWPPTSYVLVFSGALAHGSSDSQSCVSLLKPDRITRVVWYYIVLAL